VAAEPGPLEQFAIKPLIPIHIGGINASYTNSALFMTLAVVLITALLVLSTRRRSLVPSRWQSISELAYEFIANMVRENAGTEGMQFFPFVFTLFTFVLCGNLLGLIPYAFTFTSHIIVTFALAAVIFIGVTIVGIAKHGIGFVKLFAPHGVPVWLLPLLVPIELLSYCIRPFTLSFRLFINMMVGHMLLAIVAGFAVALGIFAIFPVAVDMALVMLELLVACLQAFVFAILTCIYLNDALHLH
jgi:F-type H+-transporting ATPase subunit a